MSDITIWLNPGCSKCRGADQLLTDLGVEARKIFYLDTPPDRAEISRVVDLLGGDPRSLLRTGEKEFVGLEDADREALLDALAAHPQLIERPVVLVRDQDGDRAVVARPPERLLELLSGRTGGG